MINRFAAARLSVRGLVIVALAVLAFANLLDRPKYNWDVIGYVASAYSYLGYSGDELSELTFDDVESVVTEERFAAMTSGPYRGLVYEDPKALEQQLPLYEIRVLYVGLVLLASQLGPSVAASTAIVSAAAAAFALFFALMVARMRNMVGLVLLALVLFHSPIELVGRISTPDSLAIAMAMLGIWLSQHRPSFGLLTLCLLPLARTDYAIFAVYSLIAHRAKISPIVLVFSTALCVALYFVVTEHFENHGLVHIFNFTLISGPQPYPAEMELSSDISDYLGAYVAGLNHLVSQLPTALAALFVILRVKVQPLDDEGRWIVVALAFVLTHFSVFPAAFERSYAVATILVLLFVARKLEGWLVALTR